MTLRELIVDRLRAAFLVQAAAFVSLGIALFLTIL
jgi:hypothetical protein